MDINQIEEMILLLKRNQNLLPESLITLVNLFQVEFYVTQDKFEMALETLKTRSLDYDFTVLERMINIVLHNQQCTYQIAFQFLQYFQRSRQLIQQKIDIYAKWMRVIISTAVAFSKTETLSCLEEFLNQKLYQRQEYPQKELYYLIVITWNEGIISCSGNNQSKGESWCNISFELLKYYREYKKRFELEKQMQDTYRMFTSKKKKL